MESIRKRQLAQRSASDVALVTTVVAVAGGLAAGGLVGFRLGERARGSRREYWAMNAAVVFGCAALDFAGLATGRYWLAYSAVGLMGGLITGMKYGFSDSIAVWRMQAVKGAPTEETPDAPADSQTELPGEPGDSAA